MDWRCQDGERKWCHHHARREQNWPGGEEVSDVSQCVITLHVLSGWRLHWLRRWDVMTQNCGFPAGKLWLRRESREPKNWTSCSSRPVPKPAAMSNRWFLQLRHSFYGILAATFSLPSHCPCKVTESQSILRLIRHCAFKYSIVSVFQVILSDIFIASNDRQQDRQKKCKIFLHGYFFLLMFMFNTQQSMPPFNPSAFLSLPFLLLSPFSLSPFLSCFVELLPPYLEWKAWTTQTPKAVSFPDTDSPSPQLNSQETGAQLIFNLLLVSGTTTNPPHSALSPEATAITPSLLVRGKNKRGVLERGPAPHSGCLTNSIYLNVNTFS